MFFEFVAAIAAAFLGAGLALLAGWLSGGRMPRWLMPVAAGAGMLGYTIWSEYTWYARTTSDLPPGVSVTLVNESRAVYRPWTYAVPMVNRFAAVDTVSVRTNDAAPGARIADMYFFERWQPQRRIEVMFDCPAGRHAPLVTVSFEEGGGIAEAAWSDVGAEDPSLAAACGAA